MATKFYTCRTCKRNDFDADEMIWKGRCYRDCKKCYNIYQSKIRLKRKSEGRLRLPVKTLYGITEEQYYKLVELHLGGCAICKQPCKIKSRLSVDHDHKTGKIRGLLCHNCNVTLGNVKEDEDILSGMIEYLKNDGALTGINY